MELTESGLVLVAVPELVMVPFKHLVTSLDEDHFDKTLDCGRVINISGYTEWHSEERPLLTMGWDWVLDDHGRGAVPWRSGLPRTNANLITAQGKPLDWIANLETLGRLIDALFPWQCNVFVMQK
jgi:Domain of unknown function (DUF4902)